MKKDTYIRVTDESKNGFVETLELAQAVLQQMVDSSLDSGEPESYTFTTIEMTPKEFEALPEFSGF